MLSFSSSQGAWDGQVTNDINPEMFPAPGKDQHKYVRHLKTMATRRGIEEDASRGLAKSDPDEDKVLAKEAYRHVGKIEQLRSTTDRAQVCKLEDAHRAWYVKYFEWKLG